MRFRSAVLLAFLAMGCSRGHVRPDALAASMRGRQAIGARGCGVCHTIDGVPNANARAAPSLNGIANRQIIAGRLPNTRDNMVKWILNPAAIQPGVAMPPLVDADTQAARDIVAYLYGIR